MHQVAVQRELLQLQMGGVERGDAGRLVDAAALHADEAVLDDVDPTHAVAAGDFVELLHHLQRALLGAVDR